MHDDFRLHNDIKRACGMVKSSPFYVTIMVDTFLILKTVSPNGQIILHNTHLFDSESEESQISYNVPITEPSILVSELKAVLRKTKIRKGTGSDKIPLELLTLLDDDGIRLLNVLFHRIYETSDIPAEWTQSAFIPTPKKPNRKDALTFAF